MISPVSSTESVVWVTYASFESAGRSRASDLLDRLDEQRRVRRLAHGPDDLLVPLVADEDDRVALVGVAAGLDVHLRDERADCVDDVVPELRGVRVHRRRHPVRGVHDGRAVGHLGLLLDEDRAARFEIAYDVDVVDDLLADVDRRAIVLERALDRLDGALDARAVPAWGGEENAFHHRPQGSVSARTGRRGCPR